MALHILNRMSVTINHCKKVPDRGFFYWLTVIFNRVDQERIRSVGPDRACAEWLLRNGASVRWKNVTQYLKDYNSLSSEKSQYYIQAVDATDSGVTHVGFPHFVGCRYIDEMKFVKCIYLYDHALPLLSAVKDTLTTLEIRDCKSITDQGVRSLKNLKNLKTLKLAGMPYLEDKALLRKELAEALPDCAIELK
ncbi:ATP synthase subunit s, mitochondrial-like isoform X2 [Nylanderia fulva]|uniref:ATP synthase subunit s, mitochondrial-like n=1 Tax=Nylanderia fulva TaxID=613905 RepID=UPI0010FBB51F|nr:ATP synthase subunit s, mitochondrial-like [Nylanderia fulva]XP_029161660.1 ATP synthase subunit s, mitochondrial-like isoform X2 [Nylanderia fulva]